MTEAGKCTNSADKCIANTYCPATSTDEVDCKPCDVSITSPQGCNCVSETKIDNCMACSADKCIKCISGFAAKADRSACEACSANCLNCSATDKCDKCKDGFYLDPATNACKKCNIFNCATCLSAATCTSCDDGFTVQNNKCLETCNNTKTCTRPTDFCDYSAGICKGCTTGCSLCKSEAICGDCNLDNVPNIYGVCEKKCDGATATKAGEYCKDGMATVCAAGLTQQCNCGTAMFCGSCSEDKTKCASCLSGFKMNGDVCEQCADGYEKFQTLCLKPSGADPAKLSGGAIAGIVIGAIVVVGGVGGGLAYYFIKKAKK